jgi:hypothetical protein
MLTSKFSTRLSARVRRAALVAATASAATLFFATGASMQAPRFYPDDPIAREPESQDASKTTPYEKSQMYDLMYNLFVNSGHEASGLRAKNINTIRSIEVGADPGEDVGRTSRLHRDRWKG